MTAKNASTLTIIVLISIYLVLLALPITEGDSTTTTFIWLKNILAEPATADSSGWLNLIHFGPYIILLITTIYFFLYVRDSSEQNFKKLQAVTLFFLGAFLFEMIFRIMVLGLTGNTSSYKPTITPFLVLGLIFSFSYLIYWKPKIKTVLAATDPVRTIENKNDEIKRPFDIKDLFGLIALITIVILLFFGYRACNNKIENLQEESGYNENVNKLNETIKSGLSKWFLALPEILQILLLFSVSIAISYFIVRECRKYFLREKTLI